MIFLTVEEVIQIHDELVSEYGGLHGIRDMELLVSAIEMPKSPCLVNIFTTLFLIKHQPIFITLFVITHS